MYDALILCYNIGPCKIMNDKNYMILYKIIEHTIMKTNKCKHNNEERCLMKKAKPNSKFHTLLHFCHDSLQLARVWGQPMSWV